MRKLAIAEVSLLLRLKMKSKTKISKQTKRKTNRELIEIINLAKKNEGWKDVAEVLAGPTRKLVSINLSEINDGAEDKDVVIIPGKVLSMGKINKKIKISALKFSSGAMEKLKSEKISFNTIEEEIKSNPEANGVKILRK